MVRCVSWPMVDLMPGSDCNDISPIIKPDPEHVGYQVGPEMIKEHLAWHLIVSSCIVCHNGRQPMRHLGLEKSVPLVLFSYIIGNPLCPMALHYKEANHGRCSSLEMTGIESSVRSGDRLNWLLQRELFWIHT